ncbi:MAG: T9SS type A sorting domain-containing protein, partial [candidate division WOR-3 bacterium]
KMTNIQWQIPEQSNVIITIYDATGRKIKTLVNDNLTAGFYRTIWNRTDDNNRKVPAGIYFYELKANDYTARHKMIIAN